MPGSPPPSQGLPRFLGMVFGFIFGSIGLAVIIYLWTASGFGAPPLFFRIVGSLIAFGSVAMGGALFFQSLKGLPQPPETITSPFSSAGSKSGSGYVCPACGARLGEDTDVSPKGDVKCGYCRQWFNIHG